MIDPTKFKARRQDLGMTQQQLAIESGLSFSAVRKLETDPGPRTAYETVIRAAAALGRSPSWFHLEVER